MLALYFTSFQPLDAHTAYA